HNAERDKIGIRKARKLLNKLRLVEGKREVDFINLLFQAEVFQIAYLTTYQVLYIVGRRSIGKEPEALVGKWVMHGQELVQFTTTAAGAHNHEAAVGPGKAVAVGAGKNGEEHWVVTRKLPVATLDIINQPENAEDEQNIDNQ
nr:hypothetical protein [Tanacetum cinerariifolium]